MCGIAGIFAYAEDAPPVDEPELLRIRERMRARGPDGAGVWVAPDRRIGLAHRRLAIIDLTPDGAQPMASADGRYLIVFNGEIYNYLELRAELAGSGAVFRSHSDTEVLLHLFAREGPGMCVKLRGMYAIAIWDSVDQVLFLARDPFGIKPLYVHDDGAVLRFASQMKALLAGGGIPAEIDPEGAAGFWIWGHVPEPGTLYRNIRALQPGTWLRLSRDGRRQGGTFDSVERMLSGNEETPVLTLREALIDSVRHHLIADVPVCVFLSSGIDSCTLAALVAECGSDLRTVTIGFEEYRGTPSDETVMAERVARRHGAVHQTLWIGPNAFANAFDAFIDSMDQPSIDGLNTWLVARAAASLGVKVAISGVGGDEFFAGYPSFRHVPLIRSLARPLASVPGLGHLSRLLAAPLARRFTSEKYAGLVEYGSTWEGAYLLRRAIRMPWEVPGASASIPGSGSLSARSIGDDRAMVSLLESTRYMRNQLLRDSDWAGMAHSLELRVPLVDAPLARNVARLRGAGHSCSKRDLAGAAQPPLPRELVERAKTGFTVPVREWMARGASTDVSQRGLRGWQEAVAREFKVVLE